MYIDTILENEPTSTQNPLLSTSEFFKYFKRRFRWVNRKNSIVSASRKLIVDRGTRKRCNMCG
jgi:hypothetical protein